MKKALIAVVMMTGATAWAGQSAKRAERNVTVCIGHGQDEVTSQALEVASKIFAGTGVRMQWHENVRYCQAHPEEAILVSYSHNTPKDRRPGALAYAFPYEGVHIEVFYDRLLGNSSDIARARILGHVLAHEITHIMQATARHAESGVMKARWSYADLRAMQSQLLRFTEGDITLINRGLDVRAAQATHQARGTIVAAALTNDRQ